MKLVCYAFLVLCIGMASCQSDLNSNKSDKGQSEYIVYAWSGGCGLDSDFHFVDTLRGQMVRIGDQFILKSSIDSLVIGHTPKVLEGFRIELLKSVKNLAVEKEIIIYKIVNFQSHYGLNSFYYTKEYGPIVAFPQKGGCYTLNEMIVFSDSANDTIILNPVFMKAVGDSLRVKALDPAGS